MKEKIRSISRKINNRKRIKRKNTLAVSMIDFNGISISEVILCLEFREFCTFIFTFFVVFARDYTSSITI